MNSFIFLPAQKHKKTSFTHINYTKHTFIQTPGKHHYKLHLLLTVSSQTHLQLQIKCDGKVQIKREETDPASHQFHVANHHTTFCFRQASTKKSTTTASCNHKIAAAGSFLFSFYFFHVFIWFMIVVKFCCCVYEGGREFFCVFTFNLLCCF